MNRSIALILLGMLTILPVMIMGSAIEVQAESIDNWKAEADRLFKQGNDQLAANQLQEALKSLQQALAIYQANGDRAGEGQALKSIGNFYNSSKDYPKAIEYQQKALAIASEIKDFDLEARALNNLGLAYKNRAISF
jgi:tetratricopeptide (TPR) repeat protein